MSTQYVSYLRVSRKKQGRSGLGLAAQRDYVSYFSKIDGAEIVKEFVEVEGGGDVTKRPVLKDAIKMCCDLKCFLIVAKVDRLSRSTPDGLAILEELNGRLICCDIPGGPVDEFMLTMYLAFAARELLLIRLRTKAALKAKRDSGFKLGKPENLNLNHRAKGSDQAAKKTNEFRTDRKLTSMVESCVRDGMDYDQLAQELNSHGFLTYRQRPYNYYSAMRLVKATIKN
ncbi:recombinase family protein [Dyadobacter sp. CY312]|uniref:recombinase family protein n=1 Tax=Dyadobacter sp. CY312 TaxID=2907303 RepID=UPI001F3F4921|nr:recombinase family protein [Dyadobacter sp. CY312]MCE7039179.1 recombinase family protein [Dyadobacter sp. CY312]